jgi:phage anti-repressor protein
LQAKEKPNRLLNQGWAFKKVNGVIMHQLIKISNTNFHGEAKQTVNARDLHVFLESKQKFADWIKDRIFHYNFTQDVDFVVIHNFMNDETAFGGKRNIIDYFMSLDMAKELSMVERNAKGKEARQYFIECERVAKSQQFAIPQTLSQALLLAAQQAEQIEQQQALLAQQAPKVAALERIASSEGSQAITVAAKILGQQPKKFFAWLNEKGWIFKRTAGDTWEAFADKIKAGYLEMTTVNTGEPDNQKLRKQVKVTPKGMTKLSEMLSVGGAV